MSIRKHNLMMSLAKEQATNQTNIISYTKKDFEKPQQKNELRGIHPEKKTKYYKNTSPAYA